jgi:hypothetical protein
MPRCSGGQPCILWVTIGLLADDTLSDTAGSFNFERLTGWWRGGGFLPPPTLFPVSLPLPYDNGPFNFERPGGGAGNLAQAPSANEATVLPVPEAGFRGGFWPALAVRLPVLAK